MKSRHTRYGSMVVAAGLIAAFLTVGSSASADSSRTLKSEGTAAASASYNSSRNEFTISDLKADGHGVQIEYSFTRISGVKYVYNSGGSGTSVTRKITVPSDATQINWRLVLVDGTRPFLADTTIVKDTA